MAAENQSLPNELFLGLENRGGKLGGTRKKGGTIAGKIMKKLGLKTPECNENAETKTWDFDREMNYHYVCKNGEWKYSGTSSD